MAEKDFVQTVAPPAEDYPGLKAQNTLPAPKGFSFSDDDAFAVNTDNLEGAWLSFLPPILNMGTLTIAGALLGFTCGALMYEFDANESWVECGGAYLTDGDGVLYLGATESCWYDLLGFPATLWLNALKCLINPLLASMMIVLPSRLKSLGALGQKMACLLLATSMFAAIEGIVWVNIIQPGGDSTTDFTDLEKDPASLGDPTTEFEAFLAVFINAVPSNIFSSLAGSKPLGIITFFLAFGTLLLQAPRQWREPIFAASKGTLRFCFLALMTIMWWTPVGMFSLVCNSVAQTSDLWNVFEFMGKYVATQLLGQFLHTFAFYFGLLFLTTGENPLAFYRQIYMAPFVALTTSSSGATLPVTIRVNKAAGTDKKLCDFVLPLGMAINMDGTSLGFPVMVMFAAQLANHSVSAGHQLLVGLLAMVCSLGTAPIPNAGLIYLVMLLNAAEIAYEDYALGMGLIVTVDWVIDRVETCQNVTSDSFIARILNHYAHGRSGILTPLMKGITLTNIARASERGAAIPGGVDTEMAKDFGGL